MSHDTPRGESREEVTLSDVSQGDPHLPPAGQPHLLLYVPDVEDAQSRVSNPVRRHVLRLSV